MTNFKILILFFYFYAIFGWCMEVIVSLVLRKKLINRGFLIGPICPIYGVGCVIIILMLYKYKDDPLTLFLWSMVVASILEYITSFLMEKIFKNRWWDYSNFIFNINGRICLETTVPFGILSLLMVYIINPFLFNIFSSIPNGILNISLIIVIIITILDIIYSFNIIINLKNLSNSIRVDSTEIITKKVKESFANKNLFYKRLLDSFPDMKIFNKMTIIKRKLKKEKEKLKKAKSKRKSN